MARTDALKVGPLRVAPHVRDGRPSGRWLIDVPPHLADTGRRKRLLFADRAAAVSEAKHMLREIQLRGIVYASGSMQALANVAFEEASKLWIDAQLDRVATQKKREVSLATHAYRLQALLAHLATKDIARIGEAEITGYQRARLASDRSPATVNSETRLLKQILKWCYNRGLVDRVPEIEPIPEPRKRVEVPTLDEVLDIIDALPARQQLVVRFLAETGCRSGEAFALEWNDLKPDDGMVMIRRKSYWTPKTQHSDRDVFIGAALMTDLLDMRKEQERTAADEELEPPKLVFLGRGGGRMWDFRKALQTAIKKAGVLRDGVPMHVSPHLLRKAHATWQVMRGVDPRLLQPRLGHAMGSAVTAKHYTHFSTDDMRSTVIDISNYRGQKLQRVAK